MVIGCVERLAAKLVVGLHVINDKLPLLYKFKGK